MKRAKIIKYFRNILLGISVILLLMVLIPFLFPKQLNEKIKAFANESLNATLNYKKASFTFFSQFPTLSLSVKDVTLMSAAPFQEDTLLKAKEVSLGVDLFSLFSERIIIDNILVDDASLKVSVSKDGKASYDIYQSVEDSSSTSEGIQLGIKKIRLKDIQLTYNDHSLPMFVQAKNLNYTGKGDMSKSAFELLSSLNIEKVNLQYDGQPFLRSKKVVASLVTKINTGKLLFLFEKNDVKINRLPLNFKGSFAVLKNGYDIDFKLKTLDADLAELLSVLPPSYVPWLNETTLKGQVVFNASLKGRYNAATSQQPSLNAALNIKNGYLAHKKAPAPLEQLHFDFNAALPGMNFDQLQLNLDTFYFQLGKDYFKSAAHVKGYDQPYIVANADANIDVGQWEKALGLPDWEASGRLKLLLDAKGTYATEVVKTGLRKTTTKIVSIPAYHFNANLSKGSIHYLKAPLPVSDAQFDIQSSSKGHPDDVKIALSNILLKAGNNVVKGFFKLENITQFLVDAQMNVQLALEDIEKIYPVDSIDLAGQLSAQLQLKGAYLPDEMKFPKGDVRLKINNGRVLTAYYPSAIEKIQVSTRLYNENGAFDGVHFEIEPVSLEFEGQPFMLQANVDDLQNIRFDITSKGTLNIGRIYKVFAQPGLDIDGLVRTDLQLKGLQSDALAGNYRAIDNKGTLEMEKIRLSMQEFPYPLEIKDAFFRLQQDKLNIEKLNAAYTRSDLSVNGYLSNITAYILEKNQVLNGQINLAAQQLFVNDFTFNAPETDSSSAAKESGVVMLPDYLQMKLNAQIAHLYFDSMDIQQVSADLSLEKGLLAIKSSGLQLADALFTLKGAYRAINEQNAVFDANISAENFDIQKVYKDVPLFRTLLSTAQYASGNVGLQYQLSGRLDSNMAPVLPSLKGGGELRIKNAQLMGFKLMNAVGKSTGRDSIQNPSLKDVVIKTRIENNIIYLERTKLKILGFRPRFEGQVSMDGDLKLKARLGLPPFGIIGIPLSISGNSENPIIQLKRDKNGKPLEEKTDPDAEDVQELLQQTAPADSIRTEN